MPIHPAHKYAQNNESHKFLFLIWLLYGYVSKLLSQYIKQN